MQLTGQARIAFGRWVYKNKDIPFTLDRDRDVFSKEYNEWFFNFPDSMKYGVYQDFFNTEEIYITIINDFEFVSVVIDRDEVHKGNSFLEARTKAIEKANEIYNER